MTRVAQVLHIFRKDLRRYWPLVLFLAGVLTVDAFGEVQTSGPGRGGAFAALLGGLGLRGTLLVLLTVLLAALVVQEDGVSTGQSFWNSRPVAPAALLGAKAIFLGVFLVGLPMIFQAVAILRVGTSLGLGYLLLESALFQASMLAVVVAISCVTRDLKGTLFLGIAGYVGAGLMSSFANSLLPDAAWRISMVGGGVGPVRVAMSVWLLGVSSILIGFQYATRRTRETVLTLALLTVVAPPVLTWSLAPDWPLSSFEVHPLAEDVATPEMRIQSLEFTPGRRSMGGVGTDRVSAVIATDPSELSLIPRMSTLQLRLTTADGVGDTRTGGGRLFNPDQRYAPLLPGYEWVGAPADWAHFDVNVLSAAAGEAVPAMREVQELALEADWDAYDRRILGRLPFREGAEINVRHAKVRVQRVEIVDGQLEVSVLNSWVAPALGGRASSDLGKVRIVAAHDTRKEFLLAGSGGNIMNHGPLVLNGPEATLYTINLKYPLGPVDGSDLVLTPEWFEGAAMVLYTNDYLGSFQSLLRSDLSELQNDVPVGEVLRMSRPDQSW